MRAQPYPFQLAASCLVLITAFETAAACPPRYEVVATIEDPVCGGFKNSNAVPNALNNQGWVCGRYDQCAEGSLKESFYWTPEAGIVKIPRPAPYTDSEAFDISDTGYVVGTLKGGGKIRAYRFTITTGELEIIEPPRGWLASDGLAVNSSGMVTGRCWKNVNNFYRAMRWDGRQLELFDPTFGDSTAGQDISNGQIITGYQGDTPGSGHVITIEQGIMTDLGIPAGDWTGAEAEAINEAGVIVGHMQKTVSGTIHRHPFRWENGIFTDLGGYPGKLRTHAIDVNNGETILGFATHPAVVPLIWLDNQAYSLNDLVVDPTVTVQIPKAINDNGWILTAALVGDGWILLAPVLPHQCDLNCDGFVDGSDLEILLEAWGTASSAEDLNRDGVVDGADLGLLLGQWS